MKNNEKLNQNNNSKIIITVMALIIIGLVGYIIYTKFIQKSDNLEPKTDNTQEQECNCSNSSASCLGEKITGLKKIDLTTTNQDIKIGEKTFKIRKDSEGALYVNDQKINVEGSDFWPSNVYVTNKYLFATIVGQFYEGIWYAIGEEGEIGVNVHSEYTMQNFKVVDGYLHATGGKVYSTGYDLDVDMKDLLIKYIDNTLIVTYAK